MKPKREPHMKKQSRRFITRRKKRNNVYSTSTLSNALALLGTALVISACAGGPVTNARICAEIPFIDGPEGACVWTVTQKTELVNATEWSKQRPTMLMI